VVAVPLAEMGAVAARADREVRAVVHQHRDAAGLRDGQDRRRRAEDRVVRGVLQPDLQRPDVARIERAGELFGEGCDVRDRGRRDEIEAGARVRVVAPAVAHQDL
jgi:hypothetical protein